MTRQDLGFAAALAAIVVIVGLALGYAVGKQTTGGGIAGSPPADGAEIAFAAPSGVPDLPNPSGGRLPGQRRRPEARGIPQVHGLRRLALLVLRP